MFCIILSGTNSYRKEIFILKTFFTSLLALLATVWGLILFGSGQPKIIGWWFVMFFGLVGVFLTLSMLGLLLRHAIQRQRPEKVLFGLLVLSLLSAWPAGWFIDIGKIPFPASKENVEPSVSIRLPISQPARIAWGGDSVDVNYHVTVLPERWAYDLLGQPAALKSPRLQDYGIYGVEVVTPANGTIVDIRNDMPDLTPGTELDGGDVREMMGNYVFIRLDETGTYLVIAHLMPGSIRVQPGQHVAEGAPFARVGNSGSTSEPHIHIHHQRQDPSQTLLFSEGLPLYFRDIDGPAMPTGGIGIENGREVPIGMIVTPLK